MAQAHDDVPRGANAGESRAAFAVAPNPPRFEGWLALADPHGPIDLQRLFPDVEIRVELTSAGFSEALSVSEAGLLVLMAPPAGPGDLQLAANWLANSPGASGVLLSLHHHVALRLSALELGFDDAVDLSSDPMEVVGRLSIAGRRGPVGGHLAGDRIAVGEGIELDRRARAVRRDGHLISLRPTELALLEFLAMHPGRAFTRDELLRHVWHDAAGNERTVDVYVFWLRAKIERDSANPIHLLTVRGSGYLFDPPHPADSSPVNVNDPPTPR